MGRARRAVPAEAGGGLVPDLSETQLLEALRAAQAEPDHTPGMRLEDIGIKTGLGDDKVRQLLRAGMEAGTIRCVKVPYRFIDGRIGSVPGYVAA